MHPRNHRLAHAVPTLPVPTGLLYVGAVLLKPAPLPSLEEVIQEEETREEALGLTPAPCITTNHSTSFKIFKMVLLLQPFPSATFKIFKDKWSCQDIQSMLFVAPEGKKRIATCAIGRKVSRLQSSRSLAI